MIESISAGYTAYHQAQTVQNAQTAVLAQALDTVRAQGEAVTNLIDASTLTSQQQVFADPMMGQYVDILV